LYLPQPPQKPIKAWVVVMIDYYTKAAEFGLIYDKSAASVARAFYYSWVCRYRITKLPQQGHWPTPLLCAESRYK
jgi:hypothetical protein